MIDDLDQLCELLWIDRDELAWFADVQGRNRRARPPLRHYTWRTIPRQRGVRIVAAPKSRLKEIQRRLLRNVLAGIPLHTAAHGGVPGHSVRSAVQPHAGARVLIRMDLASFFPAINAGRVHGLLVSRGVEASVATTITGLCTTAVPPDVWSGLPRPRDVAALDAHVLLGALMRVPHLPQGAPTSPVLANAVSYRLDRRLSALAARFDARYTRYVDDLTFSGDRLAQRHRHRLADLVAMVVADEGFRVNHRKTAVLSHAGRLATLGAVVNERPTLPREERDRLRAIVHNCLVYGAAGQAHGRPRFRDELRGRIAAANSLDPMFGARLLEQFSRIDWDEAPSALS